MTTIHGHARINNAEPVDAILTVHREYLDVTTRLERDPDWEHVDTAGHAHRYDHDGKVPTCDTETHQMPCDGTCGDTCAGEGYTRTTYRCGLCGEQIEPGIRDGRPRSIPGRWDLEIEVDGDVPRGTEVSVRFYDGDQLLVFGHAVAGHKRGGNDGRIWAKTTLNLTRVGMTQRFQTATGLVPA